MQGQSCIHKNASGFIRPTCTGGMSHDADTNNLCGLLQTALTSANGAENNPLQLPGAAAFLR